MKPVFFSPEERHAIFSYSFYYDEIEALSQGNKSVHVSAFRVVVQQHFSMHV
jgi:hypothetical protein